MGSVAQPHPVRGLEPGAQAGRLGAEHLLQFSVYVRGRAELPYHVLHHEIRGVSVFRGHGARVGAVYPVLHGGNQELPAGKSQRASAETLVLGEGG